MVPGCVALNGAFAEIPLTTAELAVSKDAQPQDQEEVAALAILVRMERVVLNGDIVELLRNTVALVVRRIAIQEERRGQQDPERPPGVPAGGLMAQLKQFMISITVLLLKYGRW